MKRIPILPVLLCAEEVADYVASYDGGIGPVTHWFKTCPETVMLAVHWGTFILRDEPADEPPRRIRELWAAASRLGEDLWVLAPGDRMLKGCGHAHGLEEDVGWLVPGRQSKRLSPRAPPSL